MKTMQAGGGISPQDSLEKSSEMMKKFMSELESMRLSTDEAKRLGRLGRRLREGTVDPNRPLTPSSKIEKDSSEPNKPTEQ